MSTFICNECGCISFINRSSYYTHVLENKKPVCFTCETGIQNKNDIKVHWSVLGHEYILKRIKKNNNYCINALDYFKEHGLSL